MSRFVAPDLAILDDLQLVTVSYDQTEQRRVEFYTAALTEYDIEYNVENLETDPMRIAYSEGGAYVEMLIDQRINEAIRQLSLATAAEPGLQHIGATYYGISQGENEGKEAFRDRIQLAPEAFSTAGPEGAYIFHALELDGVNDIIDAVAYSEEDGAVYSEVTYADAHSVGIKPTAYAGRGNGDPVVAPEILVVIHATDEYGPEDQELCDRAYAALTRKEVRPLGDNVRVESPERVEYAVEMVIRYSLGADPTPLVQEARKRVLTYVTARQKVGLVSELLGIGGGGYVSNIESVELISPTSDIGGGQKQVPICTEINITAIQE